MVSIAVSHMGKTEIIFVKAGVVIDSQYYCDKVLGHNLLLSVRARFGRYK